MTTTNHRPIVKIILTHDDGKVPVYANDGDAGADVSAVSYSGPERALRGFYFDEKLKRVDSIEEEDYIIEPGQTVMIDLGLKIALHPGWEMQVRSRSGLAKRGLVVANAPGTIDSGYRGPCMVLLRNNSPVGRVIKPGTRIAQFVLKRAPQANFVRVDELDLTERGEGGFGSTGTN